MTNATTTRKSFWSYDLTDEIVRRLPKQRWLTDRIEEMTRHACVQPKLMSGCTVGFPCKAHSLRVCPDWPLRGSITFTRESDNRRCRLYLTSGGKWRIRIT